MPRVRREPPRQIPLLATRCIICGRPLTSRQSMVARVGTTCIRRYGPQRAWRDNPDHYQWLAEQAAARATQAAEQIRLDVEFAQAMAAYPAIEHAWTMALSSPPALQRRSRRRSGLRHLALAVCWTFVAFVMITISSILTK
jgi:hypothetical protein